MQSELFHPDDSVLDILEFQGQYRWLSNFWPCPIEFEGLIFSSVENAYQAAKTYPEFRKEFQDITAAQAKRKGREVQIRPDWNSLRVELMRRFIAQKFGIFSELSSKLTQTGDCLIVEGNTWGDTFWGVCNGKGQNMLGKIIMERRKYLRGGKVW